MYSFVNMPVLLTGFLYVLRLRVLHALCCLVYFRLRLCRWQYYFSTMMVTSIPYRVWLMHLTLSQTHLFRYLVHQLVYRNKSSNWLYVHCIVCDYNTSTGNFTVVGLLTKFCMFSKCFSLTHTHFLWICFTFIFYQYRKTLYLFAENTYMELSAQW